MKLLPLLCLAALAQPPASPSFVNEGVVNAPVAEVWKVWATAEGYKALGVAKAEVDLRIGGLIRSHYQETGVLGDDGTIENRILAFEPGHMIALQIHRPPKGFPFPRAWKHTWTVVTLTSAGANRTHVRCASMGFGADAESEAMKKFFDKGNAYTIAVLQKHFAAN
jgi:uncharacterized protein YndB with AHSA1/START domain